MKKTQKKPALLMPAGNLEKMKIAVKNGADAVYFGAQKFNMRQPAQNFTNEEIREGINFCHAFGSKAYMTLNIALKDSEMKDAVELAKEAYEMNVDALIVQDLGLVSILKKLLPELELHASTQLTCNNIQGAEFLADTGFKKIVLARELNINEIKEITEFLHTKGIESEVFIHGAECFSYSGQCLFSSFAFNKSGNRGRCLQPCRLSYETDKVKKGRLLSMKDLCTYDYIPKLVEVGVDAFKVEGRLKSNEYIQNVARVYRKEIDHCFGRWAPKESEIIEMKKSYLRDSGTLYLEKEPDRTTIKTIGSLGLEACRVVGFKGQDLIVELLTDLNRYDKLTQIKYDDYLNFHIIQILDRGKETRFARKGQKVILKLNKRPFLEVGEVLHLTTPKEFSAGKSLMVDYNLTVNIKKGKKVFVKVFIPKMKRNFQCMLDYVPEEAEKFSTTENIVKDKFFSEFYFFKPRKLKTNIESGLFIPLKKLKELKRELAELVINDLFKPKEVPKDFDEKLISLFENVNKKTDFQKEKKKNELFVFVEENNQEVISKTDGLEAKPVFYYDDEQGTNNFGIGAIVKAQNVQSSEELKKFEKQAKEDMWTIVVSNIGALQVALENELDFWIDREMNCFNSFSVEYFSNLGAKKIVPSIELSIEEINNLPREKLLILLFNYPLLMTSKAYSEKNIFEKNKFTLIDRKNNKYRTRFENRLMKLYNPDPVDMIYEIDTFSDYTAFGIDLKVANMKEAIQVLKYYFGIVNNTHPKKKSKFTRGHYSTPVE